MAGVRRRCAVLALAAGATMAFGQGAQAQSTTGPQARQAAPALSLGTVRDTVLGRTVRVSGRLTGVAQRAGQQVALVADDNPYGTYTPVATATTNAAGAYSFTVRPVRNTRFRASAAGATSSVRTVFVVPRLGLGIYGRPGGRVEIRAVITGTPPIASGDRTTYFYFRPFGSTLFRRIAVRELAGPFGNVLRAVALVRKPSSNGAGTYLYCSKDPFIIGMGRPFFQRGCGQLSFR